MKKGTKTIIIIIAIVVLLQAFKYARLFGKAFEYQLQVELHNMNDPNMVKVDDGWMNLNDIQDKRDEYQRILDENSLRGF